MTGPEQSNGQMPPAQAQDIAPAGDATQAWDTSHTQGDGGASAPVAAAPQPEAVEPNHAPAEQPAPAAPPPKPTRILLIRHGVNDYVKKGLLAGRTPGVHLNVEGLAQAESLADRLAGEKIAAVYSSPLERCQETAQPTAARLGLELRTLEDVKETNCGSWTGQALDELRKLDLWTQIQINPSGFQFPGGESMLEIQSRMVAGLNRLQHEHKGETIAVFSHADPIKLAIAFFIGAPLDLFQRLEISPASISELDFSPLRVRLIRMNDTAHVPPSPEPAEEPKAAQDVTEVETEESAAAKGAVEEQVSRAPDPAQPRGGGPEPDALQKSDEGKIQATGG